MGMLLSAGLRCICNCMLSLFLRLPPACAKPEGQPWSARHGLPPRPEPCRPAGWHAVPWACTRRTSR